MPLRRRDRQTPDPPEDREMPRRRGRQMIDPAMEKEMRDLRARLETWRQHRDAQSVLGILVIPKVKLRLNMKKKLKLKMQQTND
jgi:hypothetical protein